MSRAPLRVALAGCGHISRFHLTGWSALGIPVVAVADPDRGRAGARAAAFGVPRVYTDVGEMLEAEQPDALDLCTPAASHLPLIREAAARRTPVCCQKPLAPSLGEAVAAVRTAEAAGVRLMVHENWRWRPWYREVKRLLTSGLLGEVFYARLDARQAGSITTAAHPERPPNLARQPFFATMPRFLLLEAVIHQLDVCRFLFGEPGTVYARLRRVSPLVRGEDLVFVSLGHPDRVCLVGRSYASRGYPEPAFAGEEGVFEGTEGTLFLGPDGRLRLEVDRPGRRETLEPALDLPDAYQASYTAALRHVAEALVHGTPFETDGRDNLRTRALTFAAYDAAEGNRVCPVPDPLRETLEEPT